MAQNEGEQAAMKPRFIDRDLEKIERAEYNPERVQI